jgi:hypothetical protein
MQRPWRLQQRRQRQWQRQQQQKQRQQQRKQQLRVQQERVRVRVQPRVRVRAQELLLSYRKQPEQQQPSAWPKRESYSFEKSLKGMLSVKTISGNCHDSPRREP